MAEKINEARQLNLGIIKRIKIAMIILNEAREKIYTI